MDSSIEVLLVLDFLCYLLDRLEIGLPYFLFIMCSCAWLLHISYSELSRMHEMRQFFVICKNTKVMMSYDKVIKSVHLCDNLETAG